MTGSQHIAARDQQGAWPPPGRFRCRSRGRQQAGFRRVVGTPSTPGWCAYPTSSASPLDEAQTITATAGAQGGYRVHRPLNLDALHPLIPLAPLAYATRAAHLVPCDQVPTDCPWCGDAVWRFAPGQHGVRDTARVSGSGVVALVVVVVLAVAFDVTNGFHDSSNSIAAPVATRAMRPGTAVALSAVFTLLGPILAGTAVADTVGGLISVGNDDTLWILFASLVAAVTWNLATWWWGLPSSSSHALVGGLVGAGVMVDGLGAVRWGGFDGLRPVGVAGVLVALAISPVVGGLAGWVGEFVARQLLRRARRGVSRSILRGEWVTSSALAFAHGANDAQKTMGLITLALVAAGSIPSFVVPLWVKLTCAIALTVGTALGGWRIVRTIGRGVYRIRPLDGLMSQTSSALVIGGAAALGAPVSTTHIVASSVVGVGAERRWRHVHWPVVREIGLAWVMTLPACAGMGATVALLERVVA